MSKLIDQIGNVPYFTISSISAQPVNQLRLSDNSRLFSPKGWNSKAQGNALGFRALLTSSPVGAQFLLCQDVSPLQGLKAYIIETQGGAPA